MNYILFTFALIASLYIIFCFFHKFIFLRDPYRSIPSGKNIVSPADGKVIEIKEVKGKQRVKKGMVGKIHTLTNDVAKDCYIVSIFMSPFNVHINRSPLPGKVTKVSHIKGKFLPVNSFENGLLNEKNEILIKNKTIGNVKVIQIAGFLARRIECFVHKDDNLDRGQRIGLINLGSQVTLILPKTVKLKVKKGDKVKAGSSILATYK